MTTGLNPCDISFGIDEISFSYDETVYELAVEYSWEAGDIELQSGNVTVIPNQIALSESVFSYYKYIT